MHSITRETFMWDPELVPFEDDLVDVVAFVLALRLWTCA